jgi:hypothetical protein
MALADVSVSINAQGTRKSSAYREFWRPFDERETHVAGPVAT